MIKYYVAKAVELQAKGRIIVEIKGMEIGIFYVNGSYYAWRNVCPHFGAPICHGEICGTRMPSMVHEYIYGRDQEILRCPWHGWEFDLTTGGHLVNSQVKLRGYPVEVLEDDVWVLLNQ